MRLAIIIPVHDEAPILAETVERVSEWARRAYGREAAVVVSENASTDGTDALLRMLARQHPDLKIVTSGRPGKGGAIARAALSHEADIYLFMDADLATDLASAEKVVEAVRRGADLAFGSRRCADAQVERPPLRRLATAAYAWCVEAALGLPVRDAQCGCKAFSRRVRDEVLPKVADGRWFFDTELLARTRQAGLAMEEIGVRWNERRTPLRKSKLPLLRTGLAFLGKLKALRDEIRR